MRILGLDVGTKTVGVAISDITGLLAQPLEVIRRKRLDTDLSHIQDLVNSHECSRIVVGMPRNMNGTYGPSAESVREFIASLSNLVHVPIDVWDERMSTVMANRTLLEANVRRSDRRQVVDKVAAAVILQGYLDSGIWKQEV